MADRKVDIGIIQRGSSYRFTVCAGYDVTGKQIKKTSTWKAPISAHNKEFSINPEPTLTGLSLDTLNSFLKIPPATEFPESACISASAIPKV